MGSNFLSHSQRNRVCDIFHLTLVELPLYFAQKKFEIITKSIIAKLLFSDLKVRSGCTFLSVTDGGGI